MIEAEAAKRVYNVNNFLINLIFNFSKRTFNTNRQFYYLFNLERENKTNQNKTAYCIQQTNYCVLEFDRPIHNSKISLNEKDSICLNNEKMKK